MTLPAAAWSPLVGAIRTRHRINLCRPERGINPRAGHHRYNFSPMQHCLSTFCVFARLDALEVALPLQIAPLSLGFSASIRHQLPTRINRFLTISHISQPTQSHAPASMSISVLSPALGITPSGPSPWMIFPPSYVTLRQPHSSFGSLIKSMVGK